MVWVRLAFVGAGNIARRHLENALQIEDVKVVGVFDLDPSRAQSLAQKAHTQAFPSLDDLIREGKPDAAVICIPPYAHGEVDLKLIRAGIHLFVEKPVALSLDTACRIRDALNAGELVGAVGYHWRHWETTKEAKRLLMESEIVFAGGTWQGGIYSPPWWRRRELSGGQMVEQATHIVDLVRHLVGEVRRVFSVTRRGVVKDFPDYNIDDAAVVAMECEGGIPVVVTATCAIGFGSKIGLSITTREMSVEVGSGTLKVRQFRHSWERRAQNDPYLDELAEFVSAVKEGNPHAVLCPYEEGVKTLAVTLAATRSAELGQPVEVEEG